VCGM